MPEENSKRSNFRRTNERPVNQTRQPMSGRLFMYVLLRKAPFIGWFDRPIVARGFSAGPDIRTRYRRSFMETQ